MSRPLQIPVQEKSKRFPSLNMNASFNPAGGRGGGARAAPAGALAPLALVRRTVLTRADCSLRSSRAVRSGDTGWSRQVRSKTHRISPRTCALRVRELAIACFILRGCGRRLLSARAARVRHPSAHFCRERSRPGARPTPWLPASPGGRLSTQGRDGDDDQDRDARDGTQAVQPAVAAGGGRQRAGAQQRRAP